MKHSERDDDRFCVRNVMLYGSEHLYCGVRWELDGHSVTITFSAKACH